MAETNREAIGSRPESRSRRRRVGHWRGHNSGPIKNFEFDATVRKNGNVVVAVKNAREYLLQRS
jgi:hypothetical protein